MSTVRGSNTQCAAKYHTYYLVSHGLPHSRACPVKAATSSIGSGNTIVEFCNVGHKTAGRMERVFCL